MDTVDTRLTIIAIAVLALAPAAIEYGFFKLFNAPLFREISVLFSG